MGSIGLRVFWKKPLPNKNIIYNQKILFLKIIFLFTIACSTPSKLFDKTAASYDLIKQVVPGESFDHAIYFKEDLKIGKTLRIYLGGDGTPSINNVPSTDPTPQYPLMLKLMTLDPKPALYLGRPCFHGLKKNLNCLPKIWSTGRYSEIVVSSMARAIQTIFERDSYKKLELFGYSGGGTLAMLLAQKLPKTHLVITIAANLDVQGWAQYRKISGLEASLSPEDLPPLDKDIIQLHFVGEKDRVVPNQFTVRGVTGKNAKLIEIENFNHVCCWEKLWPKILKEYFP